MKKYLIIKLLPYLTIYLLLNAGIAAGDAQSDKRRLKTYRCQVHNITVNIVGGDPKVLNTDSSKYLTRDVYAHSVEVAEKMYRKWKSSRVENVVTTHYQDKDGVAAGVESFKLSCISIKDHDYIKDSYSAEALIAKLDVLNGFNPKPWAQVDKKFNENLFSAKGDDYITDGREYGLFTYKYLPIGIASEAAYYKAELQPVIGHEDYAGFYLRFWMRDKPSNSKPEAIYWIPLSQPFSSTVVLKIDTDDLLYSDDNNFDGVLMFLGKDGKLIKAKNFRSK